MSKNYQQPLVAIVGRPNVGKSTFFNRLIGRRQAIESEIPRTTRDRLYSEVNWCGKDFILIDTAGLLEKDKKDDLVAITRSSVQIAIEEADIIIFLIDAKSGTAAYDREIAKKLHKTKKPVFLIANKADNSKREIITREMLSLGFGKPNFVSAISGRRVADFLDKLTLNLRFNKSETPDKYINVAIIGRPNVGKSTLLNTLVGKEKVIVSESPGTTRDAIDAIINFAGQKIRIVDTAGIRRRGKIDQGVEKISTIRALKIIRNCSVGIILIDGTQGITNQDAHLAGFTKEQGKSIILAVNKIDNWPEDLKKEKITKTISDLQNKLAFLPFAPVIFISAKENINTKVLLKKIIEVYSTRFILIPESGQKILISRIRDGNQQLSEILKFWQEKINPPVFKITVKNKKRFHFSHLRYLENCVRDYYPFLGTPIFIDLVSPRN